MNREMSVPGFEMTKMMATLVLVSTISLLTFFPSARFLWFYPPVFVRSSSLHPLVLFFFVCFFGS
jgi:hypothetical protein